MKDLSNLSLGGLLAKPAIGTATEIDIDLIEEDSNNARKEFHEETLLELAESIQSNGVIAPISVRRNPLKDGYYVINHGHRRLRASILAGKTTIPAFLDDKINDFGRFIENIQREELSPLDIANQLNLFVKSGMSGREISERIGKSDSWVSRHLGLLSAPITIKKSLEIGKIKSVEAAKTLASLSNEHPVEIEEFLNNAEGEITQKQVRELSKELKGDKATNEASESDELFELHVEAVNDASLDASNNSKTPIVYGSKEVLMIELLDAAELTERQKLNILSELKDKEKFDQSFDSIRFYLEQLELNI